MKSGDWDQEVLKKEGLLTEIQDPPMGLPRDHEEEFQAWMEKHGYRTTSEGAIKWLVSKFYRENPHLDVEEYYENLRLIRYGQEEERKLSDVKMICAVVGILVGGVLVAWFIWEYCTKFY